MKSGSSYRPRAGDIIWLDFDPTKGHEQRGRRPALVVSARTYNERSGLCVACAITNRGKGYPFEVPLPKSHRTTGVVLADQMRCISWTERSAELIEPVPQLVLNDVREKIAALLGIE